MVVCVCVCVCACALVSVSARGSNRDGEKEDFLVKAWERRKSKMQSKENEAESFQDKKDL